MSVICKQMQEAINRELIVIHDFQFKILEHEGNKPGYSRIKFCPFCGKILPFNGTETIRKIEEQ